MSELKYLEEVDTIPRGVGRKRYKFEYEMILKEFLDNKVKLVKVKSDIIKYRGKTPNSLLAQGLRRTVDRLRLPVKVIGRKHGVYLIRI